MKKRGKQNRHVVRDLLESLVAIPYAWWAIYFYQNGFNSLVLIVGAVLFLILLPTILVYWRST